MAWQTPQDKQKFFEDLDRAFNTPASQTLLVPQITDNHLSTSCSDTSANTIKRKRSTSSDRYVTNQPSLDPAENIILLPKRTRSVPFLPKISPSTRPQISKSKSSETHKKRRSSSEVVQQPRKSSLLEGMILYFIPNSKKNGLRKFRMTLFAQHGATVCHEWNEEITHIICDGNITGERVLRDLRWEQFPMGVTIVNENWVPECLGAGRIVDISKPRFQVPGVISQTSNESPGSPELIANGSLQIKKENSKRTRQQQFDSAEGNDDGEVIDVQEYLFGRPACRDKELPQQDPNGFTPLQLGPNPLEQAISEIQNVVPTAPFIDPLHSPSDTDSDTETPAAPQPEIPQWQKSFTCMYPHNGTELQNNPNSKTIQVLSEMQQYYERTMDQWRAISYRKVMSTLMKCKEHIVTEEQARAIPGIGGRLAKKIAEIAATGELQRLQNLESSDHTMELFMGIYGVGRNKAMQWIMQGLRTLKDVLDHGNVSENQRIGIELYDEFKERIPREEVDRHSCVVRDEARKIDPKLEVYTMGSYRRGAATCGDIDLMITKPDATEVDLSPLMTLLVTNLTTTKFLTHALASSRDPTSTSKWHGVSRLPSGLHRRLDLLLVPWKERGAALVYFTGNDIFNRSLRLLASKKGMGLNQRGLFKDCLRGEGRVRLTRGVCIASESEEEIFEILGVPWRPPELRNC